jgi:hypothetical protein
MLFYNSIVRKLGKMLRHTFALICYRILDRMRISRNSHSLDGYEFSIYRQTYRDYPTGSFLQEIGGFIHDFDGTVSLPKYQSDPVWDKYLRFRNGEHYIFLANFCRHFLPKRILEVGTFRGASARVMLDYSDAVVVSLDVDPISTYNEGYLKDLDISKKKRFEQRLINIDLLTDEEFINLIKSFDLVFLDGPKSGGFEVRFFQRLIKFRSEFVGLWLIMDDIRLSNISVLWDSIPLNKIDLGDLGHWSGTGVIKV